jgi:hypothetical protein
MRRVRSVVAAIAAPLGCAATATAASAAAAAAATATATATSTYAAAAPAPTITRSAHVAFENCNARHVVLSVTAPRHAFPLSEPVTVEVRLSNSGSTTCGAPPAQHIPEARGALTVGPCGTLPLTVRNVGGVDVYPGPVVYFCTDEAALRLGPHSTARGTARWSEAAYLGSPPKPQRAPPGTYRLTVDRAVTVPIVLTSG